jgi:DNA adenine methylase
VEVLERRPTEQRIHKRPDGQLLKWIGNKFRYAEMIAAHLPDDFERYLEPFVGTGAVLATVSPQIGFAGDSLEILIEFHRAVQQEPEHLIAHYSRSHKALLKDGRQAYDAIKSRFNQAPTPSDLLVLSRACYGGVVRFTRAGYISTPMGPHKPMSPAKLAGYMEQWRLRLEGTSFQHRDFSETMAQAGSGDVIYCDPPYRHGQAILYGAQDFRLAELWTAVEGAVDRGARVLVSVDGWRRSGEKLIDIGVPKGLFVRELLIERGGCMLRRFQMNGGNMSLERVADRLLLSW